MQELGTELFNAGFQITNVESLKKKKRKNLKDSYRNESKKISKSKKSGCGETDVHKPKLMWFSAADSFLRNVMSGRESSSNLVSNKV